MTRKKITTKRQLADELISGLSKETIGLFKYGGREIAKTASDMSSELGKFAMGRKKPRKK